MTGTTYNAKAVAREVSKRVGRTFDAKRVRAWVRNNIPAYDDDGYTAHVYDRRTFDRIVSGMVAKARTGRATAASEGRGASKAATTAKAHASVKPASSKPGPSHATPRVPAGTVTAAASSPTVAKVE